MRRGGVVVARDHEGHTNGHTEGHRAAYVAIIGEREGVVMPVWGEGYGVDGLCLAGREW